MRSHPHSPFDSFAFVPGVHFYFDVVSNMSIDELCRDFIRKHNLATEHLTEQQLAEAFRQALACGDFIRYVQADTNSQQVVYIPFAREQQLLSRIKELEETIDGPDYVADDFEAANQREIDRMNEDQQQ